MGMTADVSLAPRDPGSDAEGTRWLDAAIYEERYDDCRDGAEVVARITVGGPHSWDVADNEAMWAFLSQFRR